MITRNMLMDYIKEELLRGRSAHISENDDLLASGIINSLGILQLVSFIEEQMGVDIPVEDVVYENFQSVDTLATYLEGR